MPAHPYARIRQHQGKDKHLEKRTAPPPPSGERSLLVALIAMRWVCGYLLKSCVPSAATFHLSHGLPRAIFDNEGVLPRIYTRQYLLKLGC